MTDRAARPGVSAPWLGRIGAGWGVLGTAALLIRAIWALGPVAWRAAVSDAAGPAHAVAAALWIVFMCVGEGYMGIQRSLAPRVVARAVHLSRNPRPARVALAPLFCMGLIHARPARQLRSWSLVLVMVSLVLMVRLVPQPWRGVIDAGVVAGLVWGLAAIAAVAGHALAGRPLETPLDLPAGPEPVAGAVTS